MKTFLNKILATSTIALVMLSAACKKDGTIVTATSGTSGALTTSTTTLVLNSAKLTDASNVITFNFTQTSFGYQAGITNTLQIDAASDNWVNPYTVSLGTNVLTQAYNTADFNAIMLKLGIAGGVAGKVNVRVQSAIGTNSFVYTNVVAMTVTPFNLTSWVYVVGNFNGYSTTTPDSLISPTGNGIYTGVINFTAAGNRFLILPAKSFANKYATTTSPAATVANPVTYATEYVSSGGNDLYAPSTPGYYLITLDTKANSITVAQTNTYSVIGTTAADVGGYSIDVPLNKYVNDGVTGWTATTVIAFRTGDFKIRQNNDWSFSWGIPASATSDGYGIANTLNDNGNNNIPIPSAGSYAVSFYTPPFALNAVLSASKPTVTTATYKLVKQ